MCVSAQTLLLSVFTLEIKEVDCGVLALRSIVAFMPISAPHRGLFPYFFLSDSLNGCGL
jgi:hypothetical protein